MINYDEIRATLETMTNEEIVLYLNTNYGVDVVEVTQQEIASWYIVHTNARITDKLLSKDVVNTWTFKVVLNNGETMFCDKEFLISDVARIIKLSQNELGKGVL